MTDARSRSMTRLGQRDRLPTPLPTRYDHVRQRRHVRCIVPPSIPVFVSLFQTTRARKSCRAVALDISVGGMAVEVIERLSAGGPTEGEEVQTIIDLDGSRLELRARVLSASARKVRMRFVDESRESRGQVPVGLLSLLTDLVSREVRLIDHGRGNALLANRPGFLHFAGSEHLELRVQAEALGSVAPWWQLVILDYVVTWTASEGLECGAVGKHESNEALVVPALETMQALALRVAERGRLARPEHAAAFDFIAATLRER